MTSIWRKFFGFTDEEHEGETYEEAAQRAKKLLHEENYEDACRILRYAEKQHHAEAMYYLAWCYWNGTGVREDAGHARHLWKVCDAMGFNKEHPE